MERQEIINELTIFLNDSMEELKKIMIDKEKLKFYNLKKEVMESSKKSYESMTDEHLLEILKVLKAIG